MVKKKATPQKGSKNLIKLKAKRNEPPPPPSESSTEQDSSSSSEEETTANTSRTRTPRKQAQPIRRQSPTKSKNTVARVAKRHKSRVFKEIAKLQRTTNLLIPKAPFLRLVRDIMMERSAASSRRDGGGIRITPVALEALRESSECYLTSVFEDAYLIALHSKRVTLMSKDIQLLMNLRHTN